MHKRDFLYMYTNEYLDYAVAYNICRENYQLGDGDDLNIQFLQKYIDFMEVYERNKSKEEVRKTLIGERKYYIKEFSLFVLKNLFKNGIVEGFSYNYREINKHKADNLIEYYKKVFSEHTGNWTNIDFISDIDTDNADHEVFRNILKTLRKKEEELQID